MTTPVALFLALALGTQAAGAPPEAVTPAQPAAEAASSTGVHPLRHSWPLDGAITLGAGALWFSSEALFKPALAPTECRLFCERDAGGASTVNGFDTWGRDAVRWSEPNLRTAALLSDAMVYGVIPATALGLNWHAAGSSGAADGMLTDVLIILESAALAQLVNQGVKFVVGRTRPYAHYGTLPSTHPEDDHVSFYSGHATFAFAMVVATGTVAELRGYQNRWLIWAVGLPLAATVPYFRMAADKHYLSDVLIGALSGTLFGIAVPMLHGRGDGSTSVTLAPAPRGFVVSGRF